MSDTPVVEPKYVDTNRALAAAVQQHHRDRRERIATAALQGLLSNPATSVSPREVVVAASVYADLMIAKLDEEPQP